MEDKIKLFNDKKIRTHWDEEQVKWYFSIVDIVSVLTDSVDAGAYWRKLKERLIKEGNETVTNCHGLKMRAADGKMRVADVADTINKYELPVNIEEIFQQVKVQQLEHLYSEFESSDE